MVLQASIVPPVNHQQPEPSTALHVGVWASPSPEGCGETTESLEGAHPAPAWLCGERLAALEGKGLHFKGTERLPTFAS